MNSEFGIPTTIDELSDCRREIDRLQKVIGSALTQLAAVRNVDKTAFLRAAIGSAEGILDRGLHGSQHSPVILLNQREITRI